MVIEMDTMSIFHVLEFVVNKHTKGLLGIIRNIKQFAVLGTTFCKFSNPTTLGEKIQRSSAYIKWLINVPA